jgi:NAD(P)-dependent dehydrogenase (short-subunit alcohol dehydrogenase family)
MSTKTVVITGSTRGIGFGLADAFLSRDCHVVISGRSDRSVSDAVERLAQRHPRERISGKACDVSSWTELQALYAEAKKPNGKVDVWLNSAGAGATAVPLVRQRPEELDGIVRTNVLGMVLATRVALEEMTLQGSGQIFNFEGFGADGRMMRTGLATYGASKSATRYFTRSIAKECAAGPVMVGTLFPGVCVTEMLLGQYDGVPRTEWEKARKQLNVVGDEVETVTPWLADQVLHNAKNGATIAWLTVPKMLARFLRPKYRKRDLLAGKEPRALV